MAGKDPAGTEKKDIEIQMRIHQGRSGLTAEGRHSASRLMGRTDVACPMAWIPAITSK